MASPLQPPIRSAALPKLIFPTRTQSCEIKIKDYLRKAPSAEFNGWIEKIIAKDPYCPRVCQINDFDFSEREGDWYGLDLKKLIFNNCEARNIYFTKCNFYLNNWDDVDLISSKFIDCKFDQITANKGRWNDLILDRCLLAASRFDETAWYAIRATDFELRYNGFRNLCWEEVNFEHQRFNNNFRYNKFREVEGSELCFKNMNLRDCTIKNSEWFKPLFNKCILENFTFENWNSTLAEFRDCQIANSQFYKGVMTK